MPKNFRLDTRIFLECLADVVGDALWTLASPSVGRFLSSYDDEPLERKLRTLAARGVLTLPEPTDPRVLRLTEEGLRIARSRCSPDDRWARAWDHQWRMVLFDVAEQDRSTRDRLRHTLRLHRLGYLQGSVWISPDSLEDLRTTMRKMTANPEALLFFEGRPFTGESDASLVAGAWDFARIGQAHRECLQLLAHPPADDAPPQCWRAWLREERDAWQHALDLDPLLPTELLPPGYLGQEVHRQRRIQLRRALHAPGT